MVATRQAYGEALAEIGADERIVVLDADLSKSTMTALFKEKYPERFFKDLNYLLSVMLDPSSI